MEYNKFIHFLNYKKNYWSVSYDFQSLMGPRKCDICNATIQGWVCPQCQSTLVTKDFKALLWNIFQY
jgi:rubredoxin